MKIRIAQLKDVETLFEMRTSVVKNYQSHEEIAALRIAPESVAKMLGTDCSAWIAVIEERSTDFSIASATEKTIFGMFVLSAFEGRGAEFKVSIFTSTGFQSALSQMGISK